MRPCRSIWTSTSKLPRGSPSRHWNKPTRSTWTTRPKHGVTYRQYWVDLAARKVFCLLEAPTAEAAAAVHRDGHGLLANRIYEVVEGH